MAVTVGLIASGAAAQIAALCGFEGVARVSNILHAGLQVLAGNYGKATNVAQPHASAGGPPPPGAAAP